MRYFSAALVVLGLGIVVGAESQDWFPMFAAQVGLGTLPFLSGVMVATLVDGE